MGHTSTAALPVRGLVGFGNVAGTFPVPLGQGGCLSRTSGDVKGGVGQYGGSVVHIYTHQVL